MAMERLEYESSIENYSNKPSNHCYLFRTQGCSECTLLRALCAIPCTMPAALLQVSSLHLCPRDNNTRLQILSSVVFKVADKEDADAAVSHLVVSLFFLRE